MMHTAPIAPSAPPTLAQMVPDRLNPERPPCPDNAITGASTPIRKYAPPTQSRAFSGLPSATCPLCKATPYTPHESTAPRANIIHTIVRFPPACLLVTCLQILPELWHTT